jgi:1,4-alpha-glucan branching enzyme
MKDRVSASIGEVQSGASQLTDDDLHLFGEGRHYRLYEKLGARLAEVEDRTGTHFAVWAPAASAVAVIGPWNGWDGKRHPLFQERPGLWEGFIPGVERGATYKYRIVAEDGEKWGDKSDPFAVRAEVSPATASVVWSLDYEWGDDEWLANRVESQDTARPLSIYELHLGSWRRSQPGILPTYREVAESLVPYLVEQGFTHVEFLPLMEHPFYGSWGYQVTGYFAATSRYGEPEDLMYLVDQLHQAGIGVLFDWVPSHFPSDEHGLVFFDGSHRFENADPQRGWHPDWNSYIFDYGRNEVRSFLASSALYWLRVFHGDGLRVDAVSSMIYLNYSRGHGEWSPNQYGGKENLEAIGFLRELNDEIVRAQPGCLSIAEESTSWPMVTRPTYVGGLGFSMKWDMGWMHDTLSYLRQDPLFRKYRHESLTFRMMYAFNERFCLALSHDEVVHGKRSLLSKMPGSRPHQLSNLRLLLGYQWGQPGRKLLFMGGEFGQVEEWSHDRELSWVVLEDAGHRGVQRWVADLNRLYRREPSLHRRDDEQATFEWIDCSDAAHGVISFVRSGEAKDPLVLVVCNLTPVTRRGYRIGVPSRGTWRECLNSDALIYGGSGAGNLGQVGTTAVPMHGRSDSLELTLPALSVLFLSHNRPEALNTEAGLLAAATRDELAREAVTASRRELPGSPPSADESSTRSVDPVNALDLDNNPSRSHR